MQVIIEQIQALRKFIQRDIWRINYSELPKYKSFLYKQLKILIIAAKGFIKDQGGVRASALTFYSVLSIVPVLAVAFGVAQGFGLETILEEQIRQAFAGQDEVIAKAIEFSRSSLKTTKGGLIAGISVVFLLWSVIKLMNHIENSFNLVWGIAKPRSFIRKFTDYLTLTLIAPVFIIISSGTTVFVTTQLKAIANEGLFFEYTGGFLLSIMQFAPYLLIWILFSLFYLIMPNKNVKIAAAIVGGVIAGTAFELLQYGYVNFQFAMSSYNTIYGSFAALPLFLIWLQLSWMIILYGAKIAYAFENVNRLNLEVEEQALSIHATKLVCLRVMKIILDNFKINGKKLTESQISDEINLPHLAVHNALDLLCRSEIILAVPTNNKDFIFIPAKPISLLSPDFIINSIEQVGLNFNHFNSDSEIYKIDELLNEYSKLNKNAELSKSF